jgi:hypothetical protein
MNKKTFSDYVWLFLAVVSFSTAVSMALCALHFAPTPWNNDRPIKSCFGIGAHYVDDETNHKCAWIVGASHPKHDPSVWTYSRTTTSTSTHPQPLNNVARLIIGDDLTATPTKPKVSWEEMFNTERYNHFETFVKARDLKNEVATLKKKLKKAEEVKSKIVCYNFPKAVTECNCDKTPESPYPSAVCTYDERGNLRCKTDWLDKPSTPIDGRIESEYPTVAPYYYQHNTLGNDAAVLGSQKKLNYDINLLPPNGPVPEPPCEGIDAHK